MVPSRLLMGQVAGIALLAVLAGLTLLAAAVELMAGVILYFLLPAFGMIGFLGYMTVSQGQVSWSLASAVSVSIAGSVLVVFQPYKSVVEVFDPGYLHTIQYVFLGLFLLFLGIGMYASRAGEETLLLVYVPYLIMVLTVSAAIQLTREIWLATYPAGTGITGVGMGWTPNYCQPDTVLSAVCQVCDVTRLGDPAGPACYYDALGIIAVLTAGIVIGSLYGRRMDRYKRVLIAVLTGVIGTGITVYIGL